MGTLRDLQFALQLKIEELRQRDTLIDELELELDTKDDLIRRLQGELDRYRATVSPPGPSGAGAGCSVLSHESPRAKRKTIFSEPLRLDPQKPTTDAHRSQNKSPRLQRLIRTALSENELLKHLDSGQSQAVMDSMYPAAFNQDVPVLQEGVSGSCAYVLEEGRMEVSRDSRKLFTVEPGQVFGELALLYNCASTISVSALADSRCWVVERRSFQSVMMRSCMNSLSGSMELLACVPFLRSLPENVLRKMADALEENHYTESDYIIRQGATGDAFYIISKGQVKVTERKSSSEEVELSTLSRGHWFGENALRGDDVRMASVVAAGDVTCLVMDRELFRSIVGGVVEDRQAGQTADSNPKSDEHAAVLSSTTLTDFRVVCNLGVGEMGHVDLVKLGKGDIRCPFAMRVLRKRLLLNSGQQEHLLRERDNLLEARCPFIVRLYCTFRDARCLYLLTEACLGGELWSLLPDRSLFDDTSTRFYTGCVLEALIYLHAHGIIYRDLKPENVLLDQRGYAKLVGLGCAKKVGLGEKTWTLCGTPGYMAPEVILHQGHGAAADLWSLGLFVFELLSGSLPFSHPDPMRTFSATIRGIDLIEFPKTIGKNASNLIKKLCRNKPSERLGNHGNGAKDIQKHKWFEGFDWDGLTRGTLTPPLIPKFHSHLNKQKVDPNTEDPEAPLEESDWDRNF